MQETLDSLEVGHDLPKIENTGQYDTVSDVVESNRQFAQGSLFFVISIYPY